MYPRVLVAQETQGFLVELMLERRDRGMSLGWGWVGRKSVLFS